MRGRIVAVNSRTTRAINYTRLYIADIIAPRHIFASSRRHGRAYKDYRYQYFGVASQAHFTPPPFGSTPPRQRARRGDRSIMTATCHICRRRRALTMPSRRRSHFASERYI